MGKGLLIATVVAFFATAPGAARRALAAKLTLHISPNKYVPRGRDYYVRRARAPHWELRFNVSPEGTVVERAFGNKAVRLVEGCA
jgi:hypothetical protein